MKKRKATALAISTMLFIMLTGCRNTSAPDIPETVSQGYDSESTGGTESAVSSTGEQSTVISSVASTTSEETSKPRPDDPDNDKQGVVSGAVIVDETGRGMPIFGGGSGKVYAESLNTIKEKVGSQVNVFSMVVPTQGSFYMPKGFSMANEWDCIENINDQLYGIIPVDAYSALAAHTDEEIYARTDHHWMQLGAYYAAEEFVKTAMIDVPFTPLSDYERHDVEGYLGRL